MGKNETVKYEEHDWRAEDDCRMLIEAQKIKADPARFKKAIVCVKKQAEEYAATTKAVQALAAAKK